MEDFFGVVSQEPPAGSIARFRSYPFLREIRSEGTMTLFAIDSTAAVSRANEDVEPDSCVGEAGLDLGDGIVLEGVRIDRDSCEAGDTVGVTLCWSGEEALDFALPFFWTVRFDRGFEKGTFYRKWYGKQYRRMVERKRGELYRYTVSGRITGAGRYPDMWSPGEKTGQEIRITIPPGMADGEYEVRISARRRAYLPDRRLADYLLNEDSFAGRIVGGISIGK